MKVRIKKLGSLNKAAYGGQQSGGALNVVPNSFSGGGVPEEKVTKTLSKVPRKDANLEAEGGETAFGPISGQNIPDHMVIKGARHHSGGVPLNLPDDTFIFSDTKSMRIKDPNILKMFGRKVKKGGYTPAEIAKPYDIQKYKAILMDPDSDQKQRDTAEMMIKNYIMKLGALALAQEAKKGFPQGIPEMARPYMKANKITDEQLIPQETEEQGQPSPQQQGPPPQQMPDGSSVAMPQQPSMYRGGFTDLDKFVNGGEDDDLVVQGNQDGLVQNNLPSSPWADAFQNNNAPDNPYARVDDTPQIEVDSPAPITNQQVEEGTVEGSPDLLFTPDEKLQRKIDRKNKRAVFKTKTFGDINTAEIGRRMFNKAMPRATNFIKGFDMGRIAGDDRRELQAQTQIPVNEIEQGKNSALSGRQIPYQQGSEYIVKFGGSATNPNMPESCPSGQAWNGILGKCVSIEELRMYYLSMNPEDQRRNAVLSELSKGRTNTDGYWAGLIDGDAYSDNFYHIGSQLSKEFGPDGYAWGNPRPKFSKEYKYPPGLMSKILKAPLQRLKAASDKKQFGGTPMAAYGMTMGGSYYPTMAEGGTRKIRIKTLPSYEPGGTVMVNGQPMTPEQARAYYNKNKPDIDTGSTEGLDQAGFKDEAGRDVYYSGETGEGRSIEQREASTNLAEDENKFLDDMCQSMKTGSYIGVTAQELADKSVIGQEAVARLAECETNIEGDTANFVVEEEPPTPDMKCDCKDPDGNSIEPQPEPVKGPDGKLKCPCPTYTDLETQGQVAGISNPVWSNIDTRGVYSAMAMDPTVNRAQVAMPDRVEVRPAYEDYLSKFHGLASGLKTAGDIAATTAGSTAQKQAQLSQLVGKVNPGLGREVAAVQSRNTNRRGQNLSQQGQYNQKYADNVANAITQQEYIDSQVGAQRTLNDNAKRASVQGQLQQTVRNMDALANANFLSPDKSFQYEYTTGLPFNTGIPKPFVPEKPRRRMSEILADPELAALSDKSREAAALKEYYGRLGGFMENGGYVFAANAYPFLI